VSAWLLRAALLGPALFAACGEQREYREATGGTESVQSGGSTALGGAAGGRGGAAGRGGSAAGGSLGTAGNTTDPSTAGSGGPVGAGGSFGGAPACEDSEAGCEPQIGGAGNPGDGSAARLASDIRTLNLNTVEVSKTSSSATWKIENRGGSPTGVPTLTNGNEDEVVVSSNTCTSAIPPGGSCNVALGLRPSGGGSRNGTLTLAASPGGSVTLGVQGAGGYRVTVSVVGGTSGTTVTSTPAGIECGSTCTALMSGDVTLSASTKNGSNMLHTGWAGDATNCGAAPARDCKLSASQSSSVTVRFAPLNHNLIFATNTLLQFDKGSAAAYDEDCNAAATTAGINNAAGNDYVAAVSDSVSTLRTRLGNSARGWIRRDGAPFADTQAALFTSDVVWNPILFDEYGRRGPSKYAFTGSTSTGAAHQWSCENWTTTTSTPQWNGGSIFGGPSVWLAGISGSCQNDGRSVICMGRGRSTQVSLTPATGRRVWLTTTAFALDGTATPDQKCQAERPAGVATARALIATLSRTAASVLDMAATYVRPDGTVVGTGAQLVARGELGSGIWQRADLGYSVLTRSNTRVWTGQTTLTEVGTATTTCEDWTATTGTGEFSGTFSSDRWWDTSNNLCTQTLPLRCVEVP